MSASSPSTPAVATQSRYPTEPPAAGTITAPPQLPQPGTFDILPELHALLARLLLPHSAAAPGTLDGDTTNDESQPLEIQDLSATATALKVSIQKARHSVKGLPDMERSIEEQEEEIQELEAEVERLRGVLRSVAVATGVTGK
ncbi:hypothetical protein EJ05DRAFT_378671 [Pseudovirgaria hyperparasitica]|uniref:Mediator of RNA polymerase II transcription subunit 9 n=1 Tax=Pseudovirgaria hyperparasitica TaxID=470096 RepID=A0A6A6W8C0_9PEZI|nr:uncharacterized protein EJ05DRAFT_378671 [Pseudovirgaria hyperparasitica]KAF2758136.1 hypothetical protein EJ05DRAFT_378671 [Pseudovirgaria hyperparasitica]